MTQPVEMHKMDGSGTDTDLLDFSFLGSHVFFGFDQKLYLWDGYDWITRMMVFNITSRQPSLCFVFVATF